MEKQAHKLAEMIALQMQFDDDKRDVIAYGLTAIFQMAAIFAAISIVGILFNFWYESIIIFLSVGVIKKSTGGAHSQTMSGCLFISILSIVSLSALSRYVLSIPVDNYVNIGISVIVFALCFIVFYKRVPMDSPNKPIVKPEKIKRLRKQSFIILIVFFLLSVAAVLLTAVNVRFFSIAFSIRLAMLWQLLMLTRLGARLINKLDLRFKAITR